MVSCFSGCGKLSVVPPGRMICLTSFQREASTSGAKAQEFGRLLPRALKACSTNSRSTFLFRPAPPTRGARSHKVSCREGEENVRANGRAVNSVFLVQLRKNAARDSRRAERCQEISQGRVGRRLGADMRGNEDRVRPGWADCPQSLHKKCRKAVVSCRFCCGFRLSVSVGRQQDS